MAAFDFANVVQAKLRGEGQFLLSEVARLAFRTEGGAELTLKLSCSIRHRSGREKGQVYRDQGLSSAHCSEDFLYGKPQLTPEWKENKRDAPGLRWSPLRRTAEFEIPTGVGRGLSCCEGKDSVQ